MRDFNERRILADFGIHLPNNAVYAQDGWRGDWRQAANADPRLVDAQFRMALDAQPGLVTAPSAGIPSLFTNIVDPEVVRVLTQPMRAAEILGGESKKGDWTTLTAQFPTVEPAGQVASYGDYNNNGTTDANANWVPRQSYHYQTIERYGERQLAIWGAAAVNYKTELDMSAALVMGKFQNRSYFYGIAGLQNYGLLNDPSLIAPITPAVKTAGGTTWTTANAQEIYNDFLALFGQLQTQLGYNIDMNDPFTVVLSPLRMPMLAKVSQFNVTAKQTIMENFPNLTIRSAPEYSTAGGELMQMIAPTVNGVRSAYAAFTEKMRAHPLIAMLSAFEQKQSAGTWGTIIRRPLAVAQMLGI